MPVQGITEVYELAEPGEAALRLAGGQAVEAALEAQDLGPRLLRVERRPLQRDPDP